MAETTTWKDLLDVWERLGEGVTYELPLIGSRSGSLLGSVNMRVVYVLIKQAVERGDIKADDETDEALLGKFFRRAAGLDEVGER